MSAVSSSFVGKSDAPAVGKSDTSFVGQSVAPSFDGPTAWRVSVSFRKRPVQSRWVDFEWEAAGIAADERPEGLAQGPIGPIEQTVDGETRWRYDGEFIELHHSEGEGYWLNLNSPAPCVFIMWRMEEGDVVPRPVVVTVSYNEAGRMLDAGDHVDNVPMPEGLREQLAAYTAAHYKPEVRKKVKRNDPFRDGAFRRGDAGHG